MSSLALGPDIGNRSPDFLLGVIAGMERTIELLGDAIRGVLKTKTGSAPTEEQLAHRREQDRERQTRKRAREKADVTPVTQRDSVTPAPSLSLETSDGDREKRPTSEPLQPVSGGRERTRAHAARHGVTQRDSVTVTASPALLELKRRLEQELGYRWEARDAVPASRLLESVTADEIIRRMKWAQSPERAAAGEWPRSIANLTELDDHWNHCRPPKLPEEPTRPAEPPAVARDPAAEMAWVKMLDAIRADGKTYALTWLERMPALEVKDGSLVLGVQDQFFQAWVDEHYRELLTSAAAPFGLSGVTYEVVRCEVAP